MTRYATRKVKIRAYQAAHPGMTYTEATRQFDADTQPALPLLPPETPATLDALAAVLIGLGQRDLAEPITTALASWRKDAQRTRVLAQATEVAYNAMINAPAGLSHLHRRALKQAYENAQREDDYFDPHEDPYEEAQLVLNTAFMLLVRAAGAADDGEALAGLAAGILGRQSFEFAADAIRSMWLPDAWLPGAIPAPAANIPSARHAHAAAEALSAAAAIPFRGDEEWTDCQDLIKKAVDLAHAAAGAHGC